MRSYIITTCLPRHWPAKLPCCCLGPVPWLRLPLLPVAYSCLMPALALLSSWPMSMGGSGARSSVISQVGRALGTSCLLPVVRSALLCSPWPLAEVLQVCFLRGLFRRPCMPPAPVPALPWHRYHCVPPRASAGASLASRILTGLPTFCARCLWCRVAFFSFAFCLFAL